MAVAAAQISIISSLFLSPFKLITTEKAPNSTAGAPNCCLRTKRPSPQIQASRPRNGNTKTDSSQEDGGDDGINYVLKLGGGSVAGATLIKYGSVLLPQITRPNLAEALFIIATPVVAALFLLLSKSRS